MVFVHMCNYNDESEWSKVLDTTQVTGLYYAYCTESFYTAVVMKNTIAGWMISLLTQTLTIYLCVCVLFSIKRLFQTHKIGCPCFWTICASLFFLPGHFLLFPSTNRTAANQNAHLLSPHLPPTKGTCLKFWAYKPYSCKDQFVLFCLHGYYWSESCSGALWMCLVHFPFDHFGKQSTFFLMSAADSVLRLWKLTGGYLVQLPLLSELGGPWRRFDINITSTEEYQVRVSQYCK